jgi:hypothetical protein
MADPGAQDSFAFALMREEIDLVIWEPNRSLKA